MSSFSQEISGDELLEKAIQFHDPNGKWETFEGSFLVRIKIPNSAPRESNIQINVSKEYVSVKVIRDTFSAVYTMRKGVCTAAINGNDNPSEALKKKYSLSCERVKMYKNYYTYLYGLPMKLKDEGRIIDQKVTKKIFKGKEYFVLKATYNEEVGKDTWCFYFDPKTDAMEVYQFFKESKDSGEYIYYQV